SFRKESTYVGVVFGGENVRAASSIIGWPGMTDEDARKRLTELKATVDVWGECKQKLAFMFASAISSCADPKEFGAGHLQTDIFKELMPDVPLNGMFSEKWTYGWNFPAASFERSATEPDSENVIQFGNFTYIAIVGFV